MKHTLPIRVFLIRHGESLANAGYATSNPQSIPLTPRGWDQARHIADSFTSIPSLIVTSTYLRTIQTAQPMQVRFPHVPHAVWPVHEFTYLSALSCRNMTASQRRPLVQSYWERCDIEHIDGPGAESFVSLTERAENMLKDVVAHKHGTLMIYTHGQFMHMVLWLVRNPTPIWTAETMKEWRTWMVANPIENTQVVELQYFPCQGWIAE
jgi:broad specificity phosphatase PhoE